MPATYVTRLSHRDLSRSVSLVTCGNGDGREVCG